MQVTVALEAIVADDIHVPTLEAHLDAVMEALGETAVDPAIELDLEHGTLRMLAVVDAEDRIGAIVTGSALFRAAIHGAGGHTPEWDSVRTRSLQVVEADLEPVG